MTNYDGARRTQKVIKAHDAELAAISISSHGTILATASERGQLIKLFDAVTGIALQELKRGNSQATIEQIVFNPVRPLLACCSLDKQSVHIFDITAAFSKCSSDMPCIGNTVEDGDRSCNV